VKEKKEVEVRFKLDEFSKETAKKLTGVELKKRVERDLKILGWR
jgi:hypothetical protein